MNLQHRIDLLFRMGRYILSEDEAWLNAKYKASQKNGWFIPHFIDMATTNIAELFLSKSILAEWADKYELPEENNIPKVVGIIMAGNIPLAGFHDFLSVFISGNKAAIKLSSKDDILLPHLTGKLIEWEPMLQHEIEYREMLKGCDAYIATGSNNTSRYFEFYFGKYKNIIRRNRTSVAILEGSETTDELEKLADDVYLYFGLGCRNVTKLFVPENYDFVPLLTAFKKYTFLADHHKYKNNYDYNLALHVLNNKFYMSNESIILSESNELFSPISQLNYEFYTDKHQVEKKLDGNNDVQCIVGHSYIPFGHSQSPTIDDFADGINTLKFLLELNA
ncbi:MAG: acyl-CoA reductase [Chitinophagaceae bacterium]